MIKDTINALSLRSKAARCQGYSDNNHLGIRVTSSPNGLIFTKDTKEIELSKDIIESFEPYYIFKLLKF